jgi:hypothetical protein
MIARLRASIALALAASIVPLALRAQTSRWAAANDSLARSFIALEREWANTSCTHGLVQETLLADDFLGTAPDGARYTKSQSIADTKAEKTTARDCTLHDAKVHFFGADLAVVYGSESAVRTGASGKTEKRCLGWTDTWLKRGGRWQIIAAQDGVTACDAKP